MISLTLPMRPCGECRELVSALSGCPHWRPQLSGTAQGVKAARKAREGTGNGRTGRPRGSRLNLEG